jgi:hypothetical protein
MNRMIVLLVGVAGCSSSKEAVSKKAPGTLRENSQEKKALAAGLF